MAEVKVPPAPPLPANQQQQFQRDVKDIHFDFDWSDLRAEDRTIPASDAEWLKVHPDVLVTLAGDADERGDIVYNARHCDQRRLSRIGSFPRAHPVRHRMGQVVSHLHRIRGELLEPESAHPYRALATRANLAHRSRVALAALPVRAGVRTSWRDTSQSV